VKNTLEGLTWERRWVSRLGCMKGCLDYLGREVSSAWLYGATGHAFIINMHEAICPSGPTAWNTEMVSRLAGNAGCLETVTLGFKQHDDFQDAQKKAWDAVRSALDQGVPCYGWELAIPEFYVISGYDDVGYYYAGPQAEKGTQPKPWQALGDTGIGVLEIHAVRSGDPVEPGTAVREALELALKHARNPSRWIFEKYRAGIPGFDSWIAAVAAGRDEADGAMGMAYNAAVWSECRTMAAGFLEEALALGEQDAALAKARPQLEEARSHYEAVAARLASVAGMYPFGGPEMNHLKAEERRDRALAQLEAAREAEKAGLLSLEEVVEALR